MQKYILILIFIVLVATLTMQTQKVEKEVKHIQSNTPTALVKPLKHTIKQTPMLEKKHIDVKKETTKHTFVTQNDKTSKLSKQTYTLFKTLSLEEANILSKEKREIEPVGAIRLNEDVFHALKKGDSLTLTDIDGLDYTLEVIDIQTHEDGSSSTTANYKDEGVTYTTTITHSANESFITLATAEGMYEIEVEQDIGYVYNSSHIRKHMQTSHTSDVTILTIAPREEED